MRAHFTNEEIDQLLNLEKEKQMKKIEEFPNVIRTAICRNYQGADFEKIKPYMDVIVDYISSSISPNALKRSGDGWYGPIDFIDIYKRYLKREIDKISTEEYCYFQDVLINTDRDRIMLENNGIILSECLNEQYFREISDILKGRYYEYSDLLNDIERMLGWDKDTIIGLIRSRKEDDIEQMIVKLGNEKKIKSMLEVYGSFYGLGTCSGIVIRRVIDTIVALRKQPKVMGLTKDGLLFKMDKILVLRRNR